ncbi:protein STRICTOSIDINE SYNTHASE-LIKE 12-like [Coffea eugenioides]|uniref:protein STRICTOSIDINE SYNTHASE-LIKE 12-like n=1 Tax=Coffea eugenioides TaxID=49369 RepID=UPI000F60D3FE|nr:protein STRICTOSIDINE SYNTHASE-LIKE 12-like [Coffea eugenioides]
MALFIFLLLSTFPDSIFSTATNIAITSPTQSITLTSFEKLPLPSTATSPESLAFNLLGEGPYTGVSDGRILKYIRLTKSFVDFAYTSPNRTRAFCDGTTSLDKSPTCGLPLGLDFDYFTGQLYCCDPFVGLTRVGAFGGLATTLVPTKDGVPYRFLIAVTKTSDGPVYFTDASALAGAVGLATDSDASFLLVSEFIAKRILRYWLKGEKAGTSEIFLTFPGGPNKIKRNQEGNYWVAVNVPKNDSTVAPQGVKFSPSGEILAMVDLSKEYNSRITIVIEYNNKIYVGGRNFPFVGQYDIKYV